MVNAPHHQSAVQRHTDDTRIILMDLKRVESAGYNGLPHLLVPVITEPERAKRPLKWAVGEMENRYRGSRRPRPATSRHGRTRLDPRTGFRTS